MKAIFRQKALVSVLAKFVLRMRRNYYFWGSEEKFWHRHYRFSDPYFLKRTKKFGDQTTFSGVLHCTNRKSAIFLFPVYLTQYSWTHITCCAPKFEGN